jgi:hypothetical protein
MNHEMIVSPSSERATDGHPYGDRFLPVLLAVCGALISLLFVAHVGAAGPLDTVTTTVGGATKSVGQTAQETTQTIRTTVDSSAPAAVSVTEVTTPVDSTTRMVTSDAAPAVRTVGTVVQSVNTAAQPATQQTAHIAGSLAQNAQPAVQAVAQPVTTVTQTVITATAPVAQAVTPIVQTANTTVPAVTPPVQVVTRPVVRQLVAAAPVVQTVAPITQTVNTVVAPAEPVLVPIVQPIATAVAPIVTSIAPALQTIIVNAHQIAAAEPVAHVNWAERLPVSVDVTSHSSTTQTANAASAAPHVSAAPAMVFGAADILTTHRAATVAADAPTPLPTQVFSPHLAVATLGAFSPQVAGPSSAVNAGVVAFTQAVPRDDQSGTLPDIAPAVPGFPSLPPRFPVDAVTTTTSATGTSSGDGFPLFLSLATAGWALVLASRRILPSALNLQQTTYRPLVSPG